MTVPGQLQEYCNYHAGLFRGGAEALASRLDDAQHGSMIGQRDEEEDGNSGSVEAITSFVCHHLKSMYIKWGSSIFKNYGGV